MDVLNLGVLAHVDAGKTSLCEALLFAGKSIKSLGRVDHKNSVFDMFALERERGITIFSKQARILIDNLCINIIDTPGHIDFTAETERILSVIDYALIVISAKEGVQSHTKTLWRLLQQYGIPVIIFVNKMDYNGIEQAEVLKLLHEISDNIIDFTSNQACSESRGSFFELLSYCDEALMEEYIKTGEISSYSIKKAVSERLIFPCFFGSALRLEGVEALLDFIEKNCLVKTYTESFEARIYKIARDNLNTRLCYMKITGGILKLKMSIGDEKVNEIRLYNGDKYESASEVPAGGICAVTGLYKVHSGDIISDEGIVSSMALSEPVLAYEMILPEAADKAKLLKWLEELSEQEPELHISKQGNDSINLRLFGSIQMEILRERIRNACGTEVSFSEGRIVYKESIRSAVEGVGHYEPLKHYAEVHLLLEPLPRGSGLVFASSVSEATLTKSFQKQVLSHLAENKRLVGVLTGSELTDVKISLVAGRASTRHTEGGDFIQAAFRALRQGLMQADSYLLEPFYDFVIELPQENLGRVLSDLQTMCAVFSTDELKGGEAVVRGSAPVLGIQNYSKSLISFTKGKGRISLSFKGYEACHNEEEVIDAYAYEPELDAQNPSGSIFCENGSGYYVPWDEVFSHMHLPLYIDTVSNGDKEVREPETVRSTYEEMTFNEEELIEIFERTYGKIKPKNVAGSNKRIISPQKDYVYKEAKKLKEYILVDAYNLIFASKELSELAAYNLEAARGRLMDMLSNYRGYIEADIILVFDAYKVEGHDTEVFSYSNIYVVYTKEAETADHYIEKTVNDMLKKYNVCVVTSDYTEQIIIRSKGCRLMSSREFLEDMERISIEIRKELLEIRQRVEKNFFFDALSDEMKKKINNIRDGDK